MCVWQVEVEDETYPDGQLGTINEGMGESGRVVHRSNKALVGPRVYTYLQHAVEGPLLGAKEAGGLWLLFLPTWKVGTTRSSRMTTICVQVLRSAGHPI